MAKANAQALKREADTILSEAVREGVPGIAAIATDAAGAFYKAGFGARNADGDPIATNTVLDIASMTKPIAAIATMQLVEQGKLDLEAPASDYVKDIGDLQVLDGWAGDTPRLRAPTRPLTLRHLLTHTAGMGYDVWSEETARYNRCREIPKVSSGSANALRDCLGNRLIGPFAAM